MKKQAAILIALVSTTSFAQSQVGLSAVLDDALTSVSTKVAGATVRKTGMFSSGMSSSYLRFHGQEDLGAGLYAAFRLESGLNTDTGTGIASTTNNQRSGAGAAASALTFNRWAFVALGSPSIGEVRTGRVYTAAFESFTPFDPFLTNGVGSSSALTLRLGQRNTQTALNVSNAIEYLTPHYGKGFFARATIAFGENPSDGSLSTANPRRGGDHRAARVGYAGGPLTIAYSMGTTYNTAGPTPGGNNQGDYRNSNLAAIYDAGWARFFGQYVTEKLEGASAAGGNLTGIASQRATNRSLMIGTVIPMGQGNLKFSHVHSKLTDNIASMAEKGKLFAVGYDYFLSKRTNLYAVYSHIGNNARGNYGYASTYVTPEQGQSSSGVALGLRHVF